MQSQLELCLTSCLWACCNLSKLWATFVLFLTTFSLPWMGGEEIRTGSSLSQSSILDSYTSLLSRMPLTWSRTSSAKCRKGSSMSAFCDTGVRGKWEEWRGEGVMEWGVKGWGESEGRQSHLCMWTESFSVPSWPPPYPSHHCTCKIPNTVASGSMCT